MGSSEVFPGPVHSPAHACVLLNTWQYFRALQKLLWATHSQTFLLRFLLAPVVNAVQAASMLNNCHSLVSAMPFK